MLSKPPKNSRNSQNSLNFTWTVGRCADFAWFFVEQCVRAAVSRNSQHKLLSVSASLYIKVDCCILWGKKAFGFLKFVKVVTFLRYSNQCRSCIRFLLQSGRAAHGDSRMAHKRNGNRSWEDWTSRGVCWALARRNLSQYIRNQLGQPSLKANAVVRFCRVRAGTLRGALAPIWRSYRDLSPFRHHGRQDILEDGTRNRNFCRWHKRLCW